MQPCIEYRAYSILKLYSEKYENDGMKMLMENRSVKKIQKNVL